MPQVASALTPEQPWPDGIPYAEADRPFFHGRKRESEELLRLIERDVMTLVTGPSGVGKTSLIQAGLLPNLPENEWLPVIPALDWSAASPLAKGGHGDSTDPTTALLDRPLTRQFLEALATAGHERGLAAPPITPGESLWEYFHRSGHRWWSPRQQVITPVIVLDNFEAAFTTALQNATAQRHAEDFLDELSQLAANRPPPRVALRLQQGEESDTAFDFDRVPVRIVIVLRESFVSQLTSLREAFPTLRRSELRITPFTRPQARDVLMRSAMQANLFTDDGLDAVVNRLIADGGPGASILPGKLATLAHALAEEKRRRGATVITPEFLAAPAPALATPPPLTALAPVALPAPVDLQIRLATAERSRRISRSLAIAASVVAVGAMTLAQFKRPVGPNASDAAAGGRSLASQGAAIPVATPAPPVDPPPFDNQLATPATEAPASGVTSIVQPAATGPAPLTPERPVQPATQATPRPNIAITTEVGPPPAFTTSPPPDPPLRTSEPSSAEAERLKADRERETAEREMDRRRREAEAVMERARKAEDDRLKQEFLRRKEDQERRRKESPREVSEPAPRRSTAPPPASHPSPRPARPKQPSFVGG